MIVIRGKGWVELKFAAQKHGVPSVWKTFGRIVNSTNNIVVEYYDYENKLVRQVFENKAYDTIS